MVSTALTFVLLVLICATFLIPTRAQGRMAKAAKRYQAQGAGADLEVVAKSIRTLAKFWGIFTVSILAFYGLVFGVLAVVGVLGKAP